MALNLLLDPWLEIRRHSGLRDSVAPADLTGCETDDPIVSLDFPRPDWNAAVTEFLIGVAYLTMAPVSDAAWATILRTPPDTATLRQNFERYSSAFAFTGDGPRAFQDLDSLNESETRPLSGLLMDAPGENTLRNNADLFIKRTTSSTLSLPHAAAALITLQTYAPSGGAGHRTSLRGGGPLTTLVRPRRTGAGAAGIATLWDLVWTNTPNRSPTQPDEDPRTALPWLSPTETSRHGQIVSPEDRHPGLAFFACPRRIRLDFAIGDTEAIGYRTLNYGANYVGWLHPLSPYYDDKKSGKLPRHPHAGPSDYGDWIAWWGFDGIPARCIADWERRRKLVRTHIDRAEAAAVGFDMDNMKARQWVEARFPWLPLVGSAHRDLQKTIESLVAGADQAARALSSSATLALYGGNANKDGHYKLPDPPVRDAMQEAAHRLWRETEQAFRQQLDRLIAEQPEDTNALKLDWLGVLRRAALQIFDDTVDIDGLTDANPRRLLYARDRLRLAFADHDKAAVRRALGLAATPRAAKEKGGK